MARHRYTCYAQIAREEGYHYIAKIFEETADNEKYHALEEYKLFKREGKTLDNLNAALKGEDFEAYTGTRPC